MKYAVPDLTSAEWSALLRRIKRERLNDAAPELVEAAKKALEEMPHTEVYDRLASAIAKAEEETKGEC